jgi:hypothetical protein
MFARRVQLVDRRNFLQRTGIGLAAVSLPGWLQACRQESASAPGEPQANPAPTGASGQVSSSISALEALTVATKRGRPLLVFIVPLDPRARFERGELVGVYLNRADEAGMADLASCEIWCATSAEMRTQLASTPDVDDSALAVLIETDGSTSSVVKGPTPQDLPADSAQRSLESAQAEAATARNAVVYARLHEVIAPNAATMKRRARAACSAVFPDRNLMDDESARRELPDAQFAELVPAWVRWCAEDADASSRKEWMKLLGKRAETRWRDTPPPRARWAKAGLCGGPEIEGDSTSGSRVACGMGFTSEYSARFLVFFTEEKG